MTVVVADISPINYLVLIGEISVLARLYHYVVIPQEVFAELISEDAPPEVRNWAIIRPDWVEVRKGPTFDRDLMDLDSGEAAAIALAALETNVLLLIDESAGRIEASRRGIRNVGTLGVLRRASIEGLVNLQSALSRLLATNFRVSRTLVSELLAEDEARKRHDG